MRPWRPVVKRVDLQPAALDRTAIRGYLADVHAHGQSRATAARKLAAVRTFLRYLRRESLIDDDPAAVVATPKREVRMPAHLSEEEMLHLLAAPSTDDALGRRDRAILELFYASGLRLSELAGLGLDDVNLSAKMVRVLGKGGKQRLVPFNNSTATAMRDVSAGSGSAHAVESAPADVRARQLTPGQRTAVRELPGHAPQRPQHRSAGAALRRRLCRAGGHQPARLAPFIRDAPAPARRRSAGHPGAARSREAQHDAALHTRQRDAAARRVSEVSPAGGRRNEVGASGSRLRSLKR